MAAAQETKIVAELDYSKAVPTLYATLLVGLDGKGATGQRRMWSIDEILDMTLDVLEYIYKKNGIVATAVLTPVISVYSGLYPGKEPSVEIKLTLNPNKGWSYAKLSADLLEATVLFSQAIKIKTGNSVVPTDIVGLCSTALPRTYSLGPIVNVNNVPHPDAQEAAAYTRPPTPAPASV
jgi:hypothetical protein